MFATMLSDADASDHASSEDPISPPIEKIASYERTNQAQKNILMVFVVLTQLVQMIPFGAGINSSLSIAKSLGASSIQATWIAASYPLTQGTFVLMGGRLGAVYSHKNILAVGCVWWVIWSLGSGFANNIIALSFVRGLTGIRGGLLTPNAVALLGINFRPGKQRNLAMGPIWGDGPSRAAGGSLVSAVFVQLTEWKWIFLFLYVPIRLSRASLHGRMTDMNLAFDVARFSALLSS
jgi:MFS family permease